MAAVATDAADVAADAVDVAADVDEADLVDETAKRRIRGLVVQPKSSETTKSETVEHPIERASEHSAPERNNGYPNIERSNDRWRIYRFRLFKWQALVLAIIVASVTLVVTTQLLRWPIGLAVVMALLISGVVYVAKL